MASKVKKRERRLIAMDERLTKTFLGLIHIACIMVLCRVLRYIPVQ